MTDGYGRMGEWMDFQMRCWNTGYEGVVVG